MALASEEASSWTYKEVGLLCQCRDWKTYEQASKALFRIQDKSATVDAVVDEFRQRFSPLAAIFASGVADEFKMRPHQKRLAASSLEGAAIQKELSESGAPAPGDPFSKFWSNGLFLHMRRQTKAEQLSTQDGVMQFQTDFNAMSAVYRWGDLVVRHPKEFVDMVLSDTQLKVADHFVSHRDIQLQAIKEIEAVMNVSDPFWKYRLFIYGHAFLQVKVISHLEKQQFQLWLEQHKVIDATLHGWVEKEHNSRFMDDPLTPDEQSRIWPALIQVGESDMHTAGQPPQSATEKAAAAAAAVAGPAPRGRAGTLNQVDNRVTRTLSAAVAPEMAGMRESVADSQPLQTFSEEASQDALAASKASLSRYLNKPVVGLYQSQLRPIVSLLVDSFCSGLETRLKGITEWCAANKYLLLTVPVNAGGGDAEKLQSAISSLSMRQFDAADKQFKEWGETYVGQEAADIFASYRNDAGFLLAKVNLEGMISQNVQGIAMQIVSMDQDLISSLNAELPSGLSDLAALAACDEINAVAAKAGVALMIKGAQQQMAAAGQTASAEQIQGMMKNGMDQQLATLQASLTQQSDMVNALLVAFDAIGAPPPNETLFHKQLGESSDAVKDAHKALTMAAAAPEAGTNSMEKWANNGNFLCYWGMYQMALESIVIPLHTHYKQADPTIAAFLTDQCANLASVEEAPTTSAVAKLKEIASTLPSAATQKIALEIPALLKQGATAAQKTHSATNEPLARFLGEHLSDPTFALILDTLHNAGAQGHGLAMQNMATAAPQDPSGELGQIAAELATPAGKRDFISLKLSDGHTQTAQQMIQQQGLLAQLMEQNKAVQVGTANFVEMIVKDIVPFYHLVKDEGIKPTGKADPFASLYEGVFTATGVVDQGKQAMFEQFLIFRRTVRGDATILPRVIDACKSQAQMKVMGDLMKKHTSEFISGPWLPEEENLAYSKNFEVKTMTWHEEEVASVKQGSNPFKPVAAEITFLLAKRAILASPNANTVAEQQQQLMAWGQQAAAQIIGQYANELLQMPFTPLETVRLVSYQAHLDAVAPLRRRLVVKSTSESVAALDSLRQLAYGAGSGVEGLEVLMLMASSGANNNSDGSGGGGGDEWQNLLHRLERRDPAAANLVSQMNQQTNLLPHELLRIQHAATTGLCRAAMPAVQQVQYGDLIRPSTQTLPTGSSVLPPLDAAMFPSDVKKQCLLQVNHLQQALALARARDQALSPQEVAATRKKSVFERFYRGGHLGSSSQFLLWKLEFFALTTAEQCQLQLYVEDKELGTLIFKNTRAFRDEPFLASEMTEMTQILSKAAAAVQESQAASAAAGGGEGAAEDQQQGAAAGAAGGAPVDVAASSKIFGAFLADPNFVREKVFAQQLCDNFAGSGALPQAQIMQRFKGLSELAPFRPLVEANLEAFVQEALPVQCQLAGWQGFLNMQWQAEYTSNSTGDKPELAQAILACDLTRVRAVLEANVSVPRAEFFATYGPAKNQLFLVDALKVGPTTEAAELLLQFGYPAATQIVTGGDGVSWGVSWPLLHFVLIVWAQEMVASTDAAAMEVRFSKGLELMVQYGCDPRLTANAMTPLYIAATTSNPKAVQALVLVLGKLGITSGVEINRMIGEVRLLNVVHGVVNAPNMDLSMLRLLHELGADLELPLVSLNPDHTIHSSIPPLIVALNSAHERGDAMVRELLTLGCSVDSVHVSPLDASEVLKKLGRMHSVSTDLKDEEALTLAHSGCLSSAAHLDPTITELLLKAGAKATFCDPTSGLTPLHCAVSGGEFSAGPASAVAGRSHERKAIAVAKLLLEAGADINASTSSGFSPLHLAVQKQLPAMMKFLLEAGADPKSKNHNEETPFLLSVFLGGHECFDMLLEVVGQEGVLSSDIRGNTPMHYAVSFNKLELFPKLMAAGADLDARNKDGRSLFLQAVLAGQQQVATMLLQRNSNVLQDVDSDECTGLHLLCKDLIAGNEGPFHAMALFLLSNGVNAHARDKHNCTALHYAAATGYAPLVSSIAWKMLKTLAFQEGSSAASAGSMTTEGGDGGGLMAFASVCGIAPDLDLKEVVSGGGGGAGLVGSPLFFACHNRRTDIVRLLLRGIERPHLVHPLTKVVTPGPGGTCDASGVPIDFPGNYMAASDGADFGISEPVYDSALAAASAAQTADPSDLAWMQASAVFLRYLEPVELTELLCFACEEADEGLVQLLVSLGARVNSPDLVARKAPLQYASTVGYGHDGGANSDGAAAMLLGMGSNLAGSDGDGLELTANPMQQQGGGGRASALVAASAELAEKAQAHARIRKLLVEAGAQLFIKGTGLNGLRGVVCGNTQLHRLVWLGKKVVLLSPQQQLMLKSDDDELERTPMHHAASQDRVAWLRVLRAYGGDVQACDKEGWTPVHDAAFAGASHTLKLMLLWRAGASENLKKEFEKRGVDALQAAVAAGNTVWSLERETVHGETALELAKQAHAHALSATPDGLLALRLCWAFGSSWSVHFVCAGAVVGLFVGNVVGGKEGLGIGLGLASGLAFSWVLAFVLNKFHCCTKFCEAKKQQQQFKDSSTSELDGSPNDESPASQQEQRLNDLRTVVLELREAGARSSLQRWRHVKLERTSRFLAFGAYCSVVLPFVQLRDAIDKRPLSEAFLKIRLPCAGGGGGGGGNAAAGSTPNSRFASAAAFAVVSFLLVVPLLVLAVSKEAAITLASAFVAVLFGWVGLILQRALSEDRLWRPPRPRLVGHKKGGEASSVGGVRANPANFSVLLVFVLEWQQLSAVGLTPPVSWPSSLPLPNWYSVVNLNLSTLGAALNLSNFLVVDFSSSSKGADLGDLANAEALTFWFNALYSGAWFALVGFLACACVVRASPALMRKYPFVRSDFYGQIPWANVLVPSLASALFLSVLSSLLGVMSCAFIPSSPPSSVDDESAALLWEYQERTCFQGSHRISVAVSLWGLLYYLPSAFLVGISFLNDEKNDDLDVRFLVAYEVIVSALKVCLALLALFCSGSSGVLLGLAVSLLVLLSVVTWRCKPCPEVRAATTLRFAFQASAVLTVLCACLALGADDPSNNSPVVLFFVGNLLLFGGIALAFFKLPWLLDSPHSSEAAAAALTLESNVKGAVDSAAEVAKQAIEASSEGVEAGLLGATGWLTSTVEAFQRNTDLGGDASLSALGTAKALLVAAIQESKAEAAGKAKEFLQEELSAAVLSFLGFQ